jgi:hypothetical protein
MFDVNVVFANRLRHYSVARTNAAGWEVKLEENHAVRWKENYQDWHRVERALALFEREVNELMASGWRIASDVSPLLNDV